VSFTAEERARYAREVWLLRRHAYARAESLP
jgi:hypothetical protein